MSAITFCLNTTTTSSLSLPATSLNLLPFHLTHDGPAPVSTYFLPREHSSTSHSSTRLSTLNEADANAPGSSKRFPPGLVAAFRGRRVQAHTIPLPAGYSGVLLSAPPIPTAETEDVPQGGQLRPGTPKKSRVTRMFDDEGVAGLRRSPRKRKELASDVVDDIRPSKRLQRVAKKVVPVQKFSLDSDSEDEDGNTLMATADATTEDVLKKTVLEESLASSGLPATSIESIETLMDTGTIDSSSTTTPSEIPSLSAIPLASPTLPPSTMPHSPVPVAEDEPILPLDTRRLRRLDAMATFSAFTLWTPDGPMEGDGARDEYIRALGEWVELSEVIHGC